MMKLRISNLITFVFCLGLTISLHSQIALNQPLPKDPIAALNLAREVNGLDSANVKPWHIRGSYTIYSDGVKVDDQGIYEEWWVSPSQYKRSFTSGKFKQTEYASGTALYRDGSQEWLGGREMSMLTSLLAPLPEKELTKAFNLEEHVKKVADGKLNCLSFQLKDFTAGDYYGNPSNPEACFELNAPVLRVNFMTPFMRAAYDEITEFQGRYLAKEITIYVNHQMLSHLKLDVVEELKESPESSLIPPTRAHAVDLNMVPKIAGDIRIWPAPLALIRTNGVFSVLSGSHSGVMKVRFKVNPYGRVTEPEVVEGPITASRTFNTLFDGNIFRPLIVLGKPTVFETEITLNLRTR